MHNVFCTSLLKNHHGDMPFQPPPVGILEDDDCECDVERLLAHVDRRVAGSINKYGKQCCVVTQLVD